MVGVLYGFLAGVILASFVLWAAQKLAPEQRKNLTRRWLDVVVIIAAVAVALAGVIDPPKTLLAIHTALGAIAGFIFRGWLAFAGRDLVKAAALHQPDDVPRHPPPTKAAREKSSSNESWWTLEPWRSTTLIALLMIAAALIPFLATLIRDYDFNKLNLGTFQIEVRKASSQIGKLTRDQNRQNLNANRLVEFVAMVGERSAAALRTQSDTRYLRYRAGKQLMPVADAKRGEAGNDAFIAFFDGVLRPVMQCVAGMIDHGAGDAEVQYFVSVFVRAFRAAVENGSADQSAVLELLKGKASAHLGCKPRLTWPSPDTLALLRESPNSYTALATLQYYAGPRTAALEWLMIAERKFPYSMAVYSALSNYWYTEGHASKMSIDASRLFLLRAQDFMQFAKAMHDADPKNTSDEAKADLQRAINALASAQNAWAYFIATSDTQIDVSTIREAVSAAKASAQAALSIASASRRGPAAERAIDADQLSLEEGGLFWSSVDTYGAILIAKASATARIDDEFACVVEMLQRGRTWWGTKMESLAAGCGAGLNCTEFRKWYVRLGYSYEIAAEHLRLAEELQKRHGTSSGCDPADGHKLLNELWPDVQYRWSFGRKGS